jgi:heme-degrading monooxygenase HmoA
MKGYHLAQINVGRFLYERGDPANADFMNALDPVNAHAEAAPGFIWRLIGDGNDATDLVPDESDPQLLVNMSVWRDVEALAAFVYRQSDHLAFMRRRKEWFEKIEVFMALWWVPVGHIPTVAEGMARVALLKERGPTVDAFTFRQPFVAPDGTPAHPVLDECA